MALKILIPLKKTDEANIEYFLSRFIKDKYSDEISEEHKDSVKSLNALRSTALCKHSLKIDPNFEQIAQYYIQLKILEPVISSHEDQSFVPVTWYNTIPKGIFSSQGKFTLNKISFEIANVLHLLGASAFQMANRNYGDKDEEIKLMIKYFQLAAGIFTELKKILQTNDYSKALTDLDIEWTDVFINTALAEAQQGFLKKVRAEGNKDAQMAKISYKISSYFKLALSAFSKVDSKTSWEKDTEKILTVKTCFYAALAHFHQSIVDEAQSKHGLRIANLIAAREKISDCLKRIPNDNSKNLEDKILARLESANKENQMIYHDKVPDYNSIPEISGLSISKVLNPTAENLLDGKKSSTSENFQDLVPVVVRNATNMLCSRLNNLTATESRRIDESQQIIDSLLAELNLPACLEENKTNDLPPSLVEKCTSIQANGGIRSMEANLKILDDLRDRDKKVLKETRQILQKEEAEDSNYRTKFGSRWARPSSYDVNQSWRDILTRFDEQIALANNSDKLLQSKFTEIKSHLEMLSLGNAHIAQLLSQKAFSINKMGEDFKKQMLVKYQQVVIIKNQRAQLLKQLKMSDKDIERHFMKQMSSDGTLNVESECDKLMQMFNPISEKIKDSIEHQSELVSFFINAIQLLNSQSKETDNTLEKLLKSYDVYQSIRKGYSEGMEFYNKHIQQLMSQQMKINDFCYARSLEAKDIVESLNQSQPPPAQYMNYQVYPQPNRDYSINVPTLPGFFQPSAPSSSQQYPYNSQNGFPPQTQYQNPNYNPNYPGYQYR